MSRAKRARRWKWAASVALLVAVGAAWFHWIGVGWPFRSEAEYIRIAREHLETMPDGDHPSWSLEDRPLTHVEYKGLKVYVMFGPEGVYGGGVGVQLKCDGTVVRKVIVP
ncbi:MAG: hypothetical protein AAGB29_10420 [Planctomycetota bacterium]